jgi:hypothetical protein
MILVFWAVLHQPTLAHPVLLWFILILSFLERLRPNFVSRWVPSLLFRIWKVQTRKSVILTIVVVWFPLSACRFTGSYRLKLGRERFQNSSLSICYLLILSFDASSSETYSYQRSHIPSSTITRRTHQAQTNRNQVMLPHQHIFININILQFFNFL